MGSIYCSQLAEIGSLCIVFHIQFDKYAPIRFYDAIQNILEMDPEFKKQHQLIMLGHFGSVSITLYALLALLLLSSSISDSIPLAEFDALFDLFNATDGSNWLWKDTTTYGPKWNFSDLNVNPCIDKWQGLKLLLTISACDLAWLR